MTLNGLTKEDSPLWKFKKKHDTALRAIIWEALIHHGGNKSKAADFLGIKRSNLTAWLKKNIPSSVVAQKGPVRNSRGAKGKIKWDLVDK